MRVEIRALPVATLADYGAVSMAFPVHEVLDVVPDAGGLGGLRLVPRRLVEPYVKDYDAIAGESPARWARRFDVARWGVLAALADGKRVGGAVVAFDTPDVDMLEGRHDLAVLWDLRVAPAARGHGVGRALFEGAAAWAAGRHCRWLKIETQNVNVPACRFYARQGCTLGAIHRHAYPTLPDEAQLLWYLDLGR